MNLSFLQIRGSLESGLRVAGSATPEPYTELFTNSYVDFRRWKLALRIENATGLAFALGRDLVLLEASPDGTALDGAVHARGREVPAGGITFSDAIDLSSPFGLSNYEDQFANGEKILSRGRALRVVSYARTRIRHPRFSSFGALAPGEDRSLDLVLEEGAWIEDMGSLRVALPEMALETAGGVERFRLVVDFEPPAGGEKAWKARGLEVVRLDREELQRLAESGQAHLALRVLALNWLARGHPAEAAEVVARIARPLEDGPLLTAGFALLADLRSPALCERAAQILGEVWQPRPVRRRAALYLGKAKCQAGMEPLRAAATGEDDALAKSALRGLAAYRSAEAEKILLSLLRDPEQADRQGAIAQQLAETRTPAAAAALLDLAARGNRPALTALVESGLPEAFRFFAGAAGDKSSPIPRAQLARALRRCGGEKAIPVLLELLASEPPPAADAPRDRTPVVEELALLDSDQAFEGLLRQARQGRLRALQVLAGSRREAARALVSELAQGGDGPARIIALAGLARNEAAESRALFLAALESVDDGVVQAALDGITAAGDLADAGLLARFLSHPGREVRLTAADCLRELGPGGEAPSLLRHFLATEDVRLAALLGSALIEHGWKDRSAAKPLASKLSRAKADDLRYQTVRLLRQLSGDAMGPASFPEFTQSPEEWMKKWEAWAAGPPSAVSP